MFFYKNKTSKFICTLFTFIRKLESLKLQLDKVQSKADIDIDPDGEAEDTVQSLKFQCHILTMENEESMNASTHWQEKSNKYGMKMLELEDQLQIVESEREKYKDMAEKLEQQEFERCEAMILEGEKQKEAESVVKESLKAKDKEKIAKDADSYESTLEKVLEGFNHLQQQNLSWREKQSEAKNNLWKVRCEQKVTLIGHLEDTAGSTTDEMHKMDRQMKEDKFNSYNEIQYWKDFAAGEIASFADETKMFKKESEEMKATISMLEKEVEYLKNLKGIDVDSLEFKVKRFFLYIYKKD